MERFGHTAVEYGDKYCLILVSQTTFSDKYSCASYILKTTSFSLMWLFVLALKRYILSRVLNVLFYNGAAPSFQLHPKISGTIFMAPPCNLCVFCFILLAIF